MVFMIPGKLEMNPRIRAENFELGTKTLYNGSPLLHLGTNDSQGHRLQVKVHFEHDNDVEQGKASEEGMTRKHWKCGPSVCGCVSWSVVCAWWAPPEIPRAIEDLISAPSRTAPVEAYATSKVHLATGVPKITLLVYRLDMLRLISECACNQAKHSSYVGDCQAHAWLHRDTFETLGSDGMDSKAASRWYCDKFCVPRSDQAPQQLSSRIHPEIGCWSLREGAHSLEASHGHKGSSLVTICTTGYNKKYQGKMLIVQKYTNYLHHVYLKDHPDVPSASMIIKANPLLNLEEKADWEVKVEKECGDVEMNQTEFPKNLHQALKGLCQGGVVGDAEMLLLYAFHTPGTGDLMAGTHVFMFNSCDVMLNKINSIHGHSQYNKTHFGGDKLQSTLGMLWSKFVDIVIPRPFVEDSDNSDSMLSVMVDDKGALIFPTMDFSAIAPENLRQILKEYFERCWMDSSRPVDTHSIPWEELTSDPSKFYDIEKFVFPSPLKDPVAYSATEILPLADFLAGSTPFIFKSNKPSSPEFLEETLLKKPVESSHVESTPLIINTPLPPPSELPKKKRSKKNIEQDDQAAAEDVHPKKKQKRAPASPFMKVVEKEGSNPVCRRSSHSSQGAKLASVTESALKTTTVKSGRGWVIVTEDEEEA
ncbi:hypothetical protein C8R43DRAFT_958060 [Mycena crocata]|nr:hypothetical protein C8R43DRAFT_958060 [Mycena crocata]